MHKVGEVEGGVGGGEVGEVGGVEVGEVCTNLERMCGRKGEVKERGKKREFSHRKYWSLWSRADQISPPSLVGSITTCARSAGEGQQNGAKHTLRHILISLLQMPAPSTREEREKRQERRGGHQRVTPYEADTKDPTQTVHGARERQASNKTSQ